MVYATTCSRQMLATILKNQMQKIRTLTLLIAITTISSCQFNQSVNKDLTTGAYSRGDGIGVEYITIEIN